MRLTDVMSHAGLAGYAEFALILFVLAFLGIVWAVFRPRRQAGDGRGSRLPSTTIHRPRRRRRPPVMSAPRDEDRLLDPSTTTSGVEPAADVVDGGSVRARSSGGRVLIPVGSFKGRELCAGHGRGGGPIRAPEQQQAAAIGKSAVTAALADPAKLEMGKTTFTTTCVACHNADGGATSVPT